MLLLLLLLLWEPQHARHDVVSTEICKGPSPGVGCLFLKCQGCGYDASGCSELCPQLTGVALELHSPPWLLLP